jgi:hypothetical protein
MSKKRKGFLFRFPLIAKEKNGTITITPDSQGSCYKHWDSSTNTLSFSKDDFRFMSRDDHHYVEFTLEDRTSKKLRFPVNPKHAMWVINGQNCPTATDTCVYDTVEPLAVFDGDTLLAVNLNRVKGKQLGFALNFVKDGDDDTDPANYIPWDPIINNRDGGS